ncbi:hypothetical protein QYM36_014203 [Artemia franciscana]|uniref:Polypeptide N-acetylgalactosaminyltransferase n=2 Tax=Artemia franciscana TaxID=6661 RepID=A0AA88HPJ8_ARTSF|nr:hypothetical protein QYM36_014203 [Artemia franciscana]
MVHKARNLAKSQELKKKLPQNLPPIYQHNQTGNYESEPWPKGDGPGEQGMPYKVLPQFENYAERSVSEYGMNIAVSDAIAMNRTIPDTRQEECKYWDYPTDLPKTSVVIVFHNEGFSTLLRTVHTVIERSPAQFLEEVLLIDDFSDKPDLKERLERYIKRFGGKVRLLRNEERMGLIRTRSKGAHEATGEVVLFLDAHCEVGLNWLPPLLTPIQLDNTTMTVPIVDGIDSNDFHYSSTYPEDTHIRGIFEWGLLYKEKELPHKEAEKRAKTSEPYPSPTHAGGLFAIDRKYFLELGAYDPGLLGWGGENFELSFKVWQCGGKILWVPCSRVGHVYRSFMPYTFGKLAENIKGSLVTRNYKRVIEVWFDDEFKKYFYTREPTARLLDAGDLTEQIELKQRLNCKPFKWFMKNVAYDVPEDFPYLPPNIHWGEMVNVLNKECLDTENNEVPTSITTSVCHGYGNNQEIKLNTKGQLSTGERCIVGDNKGVQLVPCELGTVDGPWQYNEENNLMYHTKLGKCLAVHKHNKKLKMLPCIAKSNSFKWIFRSFEPK